MLRLHNPGLYDPVTQLYAQMKARYPSTEGIDMGAGAGSEALMMRQPDDT
jgi:hypothetical protein